MILLALVSIFAAAFLSVDYLRYLANNSILFSVFDNIVDNRFCLRCWIARPSNVFIFKLRHLSNQVLELVVVQALCILMSWFYYWSSPSIYFNPTLREFSISCNRWADYLKNYFGLWFLKWTQLVYRTNELNFKDKCMNSMLNLLSYFFIEFKYISIEYKHLLLKERCLWRNRVMQKLYSL